MTKFQKLLEIAQKNNIPYVLQAHGSVLPFFQKEKLKEIFLHNSIKSITVTRMTVPCCGGLPFAVKTALEASGKKIPLHVVTINTAGEIIK